MLFIASQVIYLLVSLSACQLIYSFVSSFLLSLSQFSPPHSIKSFLSFFFFYLFFSLSLFFFVSLIGRVIVGDVVELNPLLDLPLSSLHPSLSPLYLTSDAQEYAQSRATPVIPTFPLNDKFDKLSLESWKMIVTELLNINRGIPLVSSAVASKVVKELAGRIHLSQL